MPVATWGGALSAGHYSGSYGMGLRSGYGHPIIEGRANSGGGALSIRVNQTAGLSWTLEILKPTPIGHFIEFLRRVRKSLE